MTRQIILPEFRDNPPIKVDIYRLSLARARDALKETYPISVSLEGFVSQERLNRSITGEATLYDRLKERIVGSRLDPHGYLGYLQHKEAYAVSEYKKGELAEILTAARLLRELHKGVEEENYKVFDENGKKVHDKILRTVRDDILELRDPWRAELLNAMFIKRHGELYLAKKKLNEHNLYEEMPEKLDEETLLDKKGVDLISWINNPTRQGLPREDVKSGKVHYYPPRDNAVAGLGAGSDGFFLACDRDPRDSGPGSGMRLQNV